MLERLYAVLCIVEHVPGIAAACLQRLHVVLNTDNGVGETVHESMRQTLPARLHDSLELSGHTLDDFNGPCLAQHEQSGLESAHQLLPGVESSGLQCATHVLRDGFLD